MSERRDIIIKEFSTFRILEERNGLKIPTLRADRELERIIDSLVSDAALIVNKDAWARYFLLVARQNDPKLAASLNISEPAWSLQDTIDRVVELAPESNQDVQLVYLQIIAQQNDQRIAKFLNNPIPSTEKLLSAHLQKICWYAAKDFYEKRIQFSNLRIQYPLEECLQIASLRASAPINLLKNFNFLYRPTTIKSYAEKKLWGNISDSIRAKNIEAKTKSFSDSGLLSTLNQKELIEALKTTGRHEREVNCYCLALQSYKEIYQPKKIERNQIEPPAQKQLEQIAARYNQRRQEFKISESVDLNKIQLILSTCVQAVRSYRSSESFTKRLHDDSSDLIADPWQNLMQDEQNEKMAQVKSIITEAFAELPDIAQKTLKLWFGLELTQNDILLVLGKQLDLQQQYQVSRRINQYKKPLLKTSLQKLSKIPGVLPDQSRVDKIISQMQEPIDEWLRQYCTNFFYPPLENRLRLFAPDNKLLLRLHYRQHLYEQQIADRLKISASEVSAEIVNLQQSLQVIFKQWVETTLDIALDLCSSADQKLASFVNTWLQERAILED